MKKVNNTFKLVIGLVLLGLTACGQSGPDAIQSSAIIEALQKTYFYEYQLLNIDDVDVLAIENTGTETRPAYELRIRVTASLPFDTYGDAQAYAPPLLQETGNSENMKIVGRFGKEGQEAEREGVLQVWQADNGNWEYGIRNSVFALNNRPFDLPVGPPLTHLREKHEPWGEKLLVVGSAEESALRKGILSNLRARIKQKDYAHKKLWAEQKIKALEELDD